MIDWNYRIKWDWDYREGDITLEELYQDIKQRLLDEVVAEMKDIHPEWPDTTEITYTLNHYPLVNKQNPDTEPG